MEATLNTDFIDSFLVAFQPPFSGSIVDYIAENVTLPACYGVFAGKFDISICPYLEEPFNAIQDTDTFQINTIGAAATGKTLTSELVIPYWLTQSPHNILKIHQKKETIADFLKPRLLPLLKGCKPLAPLLEGRGTVTKDRIFFAENIIKMCSPVETDLHGFHCKYALIDEAHLIEPGTIEKVIKRTANSVGLGRKLVISSTPGAEGGELSLSINKGQIFKWGWLCPNCKVHQVLEFNKQWDAHTTGSGYGITFDPLKDDKGNYYFGRTGDTARLVCYHCKHVVEDTEENRRFVFKHGKYICTKRTGDPAIKTFQWSAFVNPKKSFKEAVIEYTQAKQKKRLTDLSDDLLTFWQSTMGEEAITKKPIPMNKIFVKKTDMNTKWKHILMGVDYQQHLGERYFVIFGFDQDNNASEILHGCVNSWDEIDRLATEYHIPKHCVLVDCGYKMQDVFAESVLRGEEVTYENGDKETIGWTCLRGEGLANKTWDWGDKIKRYISEPIPSDSGAGLPPARMHFWANTPIKFIFESLRDNRGAIKWAFNSTDNDFIKQLYSESYKEDLKRFTQDNDQNHYYDCCCEIVVGAMLLGIPIMGSTSANDKK